MLSCSQHVASITTWQVMSDRWVSAAVFDGRQQNNLTTGYSNLSHHDAIIALTPTYLNDTLHDSHTSYKSSFLVCMKPY